MHSLVEIHQVLGRLCVRRGRDGSGVGLLLGDHRRVRGGLGDGSLGGRDARFGGRDGRGPAGGGGRRGRRRTLGCRCGRGGRSGSSTVVATSTIAVTTIVVVAVSTTATAAAAATGRTVGAATTAVGKGPAWGKDARRCRRKAEEQVVSQIDIARITARARRRVEWAAIADRRDARSKGALDANLLEARVDAHAAEVAVARLGEGDDVAAVVQAGSAAVGCRTTLGSRVVPGGLSASLRYGCSNGGLVVRGSTRDHFFVQLSTDACWLRMRRGRRGRRSGEDDHGTRDGDLHCDGEEGKCRVEGMGRKVMNEKS